MTRTREHGPVTVLATRHARAGREVEFAEFLERLRDTLAHQPGHQATVIMAPGPGGVEALVAYRFDGPASLAAWHASHARQELIEASRELTITSPRERTVDAQDAWFLAPGGQLAHPPPRWKTWLLSSVAIWLLITVITLLTSPVLGPLAAPVRFALVVPVLGALMTWIMMPALTRLTRTWLYRRPHTDSVIQQDGSPS